MEGFTSSSLTMFCYQSDSLLLHLYPVYICLTSVIIRLEAAAWNLFITYSDNLTLLDIRSENYAKIGLFINYWVFHFTTDWS